MLRPWSQVLFCRWMAVFSQGKTPRSDGMSIPVDPDKESSPTRELFHPKNFMTNSSVRRVKTAVIGCGKVAATHALAWQALPASELVGVCDRNPERAKALAARFGVRAYSDLAEMIDVEHVEILSVCTQHTERAALIETAAAGGAHVIVEKPLAVDLPSCDRAIAACRAAGVKLGTISQRRYYEPVQRMRKALDSGLLGKPVLAEVVMLAWRDPAYYDSGPLAGNLEGRGRRRGGEPGAPLPRPGELVYGACA